MTIRFALPGALGHARAQARGELARDALVQLLGEPDVWVEVADDYGSLVGLARSGSADLLWAPSVVAARLEAESALLLKAVRQGRTTYRSAFVGRRADALTIKRLTGKRAAWVDRTSLGGHLLAVEHLREQGLDPDAIFAEQRFVGSYPDAARAVVDGDADVCAVFVGDERPEIVDRALGLLVGAARAAKLATLFVTHPVPNDALVITKTMPDLLREQLLSRCFPARELRTRAMPLCVALEIDAFERAVPGEYKRLRAFWSDV